MNDIVRDYARLQVPRYTSYPTAAEFTTAVGAADQKRWLRELDTSEAVSAYLHVPYCRELCLYCGCNTKKALRDDVIAAYRTALEREIALVGDAVSGPVRIARLHWGGGTPSILGAEGAGLHPSQGPVGAEVGDVVLAQRPAGPSAPLPREAGTPDGGPGGLTELVIDALQQNPAQCGRGCHAGGHQRHDHQHEQGSDQLQP